MFLENGYGKENPHMIYIYKNMAVCLVGLQRHEEGAELQQKCIKILEDNAPEPHMA